MLTPQLSVQQWLALPATVRNKMAALFNLPHSTGRVVEYGIHEVTVKSDGYTQNDLMHITAEKMQKFLRTTEEDYYKLFNKVIEAINSGIATEAEMERRLMKEMDEKRFKELQENTMEAVKNIGELVGTRKRGRPSKMR